MSAITEELVELATTPRRSRRIAAKKELSEDGAAPPENIDLGSSIETLDNYAQDPDVNITKKPRGRKRVSKKNTSPEQTDNPDDTPPKRKRASKRKSDLPEGEKPPRKRKKRSTSPSPEKEPLDMANMPLRDIISLCSSRATRKKKTKSESTEEAKLESVPEINNPPEPIT
jgi:hypothetical protein